ncbi:MAG: FtsW/RodA/SpoVE family cell cycle protein [Clostridiales bacterium]|nr:MAG: FtsW/RodA/SpoVE family cell cycle protein [Clostridiales bacterium]
MQSAAFALGFCALLVVSAIDYSKYGQYAKYIYIVCLLLLGATLIFGTGKRRERCKKLDSFRLDWHTAVGNRENRIYNHICKAPFNGEKNVNTKRNLFALILHIVPLVGLIMLQPDLGTTMVFLCIFAGMIFLSPAYRTNTFFSALVLIGAAVPIAWKFFLKNYQKSRIIVFFSIPKATLWATATTLSSRKIAIGSGRIFGKGLFKGTQTQLGFVPAKAHRLYIRGNRRRTRTYRLYCRNRAFIYARCAMHLRIKFVERQIRTLHLRRCRVYVYCSHFFGKYRNVYRSYAGNGYSASVFLICRLVACYKPYCNRTCFKRPKSGAESYRCKNFKHLSAQK